MLPAGTRFGRYVVLSSLGAGDDLSIPGEVYRAHDPELKRDLAVKVLRRNAELDPDRIRRFEK